PPFPSTTLFRSPCRGRGDHGAPQARRAGRRARAGRLPRRHGAADRPRAGRVSCTERSRMNDDERRERGLKARREVLGDAYVDRATKNATDLTRDFQDLITRYAWGEVWTR